MRFHNHNLQKYLPFAALLALLLSTQTAQAQALDPAAETAARISEDIRLEKDLSTGVSMSMAMQAPSVSQGKRLNLTLGAGTYNGESAIAFSFGARVNDRLSVNGGVGYGASRSDFGARVGATVEF